MNVQKNFRFILHFGEFSFDPTQSSKIYDIRDDIFQKLKSEKQYKIESNVSKNTFLAFFKYIVEGKLPTVTNSNKTELYLLSEEFQIMQNLFNSNRIDYLDTLKDLCDPTCQNKSQIIEHISKNLDDYIINVGEELLNLPIQSLYHIFNHEKRILTQHNICYDLIKINYQKTKNKNIFILLPTIDGSKLSQENLEDSILFLKDRLGYHVEIEFAFILDLKKELIQFKMQQEQINKKNEETISELKVELIKNKQLNEKAHNSLVDKFDEIQESNSKYNEEINLIKKENNMLKEELQKINSKYNEEINLIKKENNMLKEELQESNSKYNEEIDLIKKENNMLKEELQKSNNMLISNNTNIEKTIIQQKQELTIKYDNRINKLKEDIIHLVMNPADVINKIINPEELEKKFLIKTGQEWSPIKEFTEYQMQYDEQTIKVTVSPPYQNLANYYLPSFLFNGIKDNLGGKNWVTKSLKNEFIKINFSSPVIANFIYMTSRVKNRENQAPTCFEVVASNNENNFVSLKKYENIEWNANETKIFYFDNIIKYSCYKILFHKTKFGSLVGLSDLNLAHF